jgi:hypothetical protein
MSYTLVVSEQMFVLSRLEPNGFADPLESQVRARSRSDVEGRCCYVMSKVVLQHSKFKCDVWLASSRFI